MSPTVTTGGAPGLDLGELPREVGQREAIRLPRADVIERPGEDDVHAFAGEPLIAQRLGRGLAHGIRIARRETPFLADRKGIVGYQSIHVAGADEEQPAAKALGLQRLQEMQGPVEVHVESRARIAERLGNRALRGEMDHRLGLCRPDRVARGFLVAQVERRRELRQRPPAGATVGLERSCQGGTHEAVTARHQQALHARAFNGK